MDLRGFAVRNFMRQELGLSGTALFVYALIYSFTAYGSGKFWGSRSYIAERVGVSLSSVDRALKKLLALGLITKLSDRHLCFKTSVYAANLELIGAPEPKRAAPTLQAEEKKPPREAVCAQTDECAENIGRCAERVGVCAENIGRAESIGRTENVGRVEDYMPRGPGEKDWRPYVKRCKELLSEEPPNLKEFMKLCLGRQRELELDRAGNYGSWIEIILTRRQYNYLTERWGEDAVHNYIDRLESYIINHPKRTVRGHFDTLRRWLDEDLSINVYQNSGFR